MSEIDTSITKKSSGQLATRVPLNIESDLLDICKKERRTMSQAISILLEEYLPIKKVMDANNKSIKDIEFQSDWPKEITLFTSDNKLILGVTNNGESNQIDLNLEGAIQLASSVLNFIIESQLNG